MRFDRAGLTRALEGVGGWLDPAEAWELHVAARDARCPDAPLAVEIGSYKGRSAIAVGLGLQARGDGTLIAIDPFDMEGDQFGEFSRNVADAGIEDLCTPMKAYSHDARPAVQDASVHLLFVDGSHEYDDVVQDVRDWTSALADGAIAAFNDPYWRDVSKALRDTIGVRGTPFRRPRWVVNTLFVDHLPAAPWTRRDEVRRLRLNAYLWLGRKWLVFHERVVANRAIPLWVKRLQLGVARAVMRTVLPLADSGH
ncbi:MAG: class I SAM-dependent methyltransferase [Actinomycetota bacterium]